MMNKDNNWKEFSDDVSDMSKKIKSNLTNEENIEDLKASLKATREAILNSFGDLIQIVENTVKDEEIKEDALNIVSSLKNEMSNFVDTARDKVSEVVNFIVAEEE